ncbi:hypothetical protein CALCODRAFT_426267, partial [Calocera cornea HHB12733]
LYCMCETLYDEERFMIGCDKCDNWYHPACVGLEEEAADLIDKFFCPRCIAGVCIVQMVHVWQLIPIQLILALTRHTSVLAPDFLLAPIRRAFHRPSTARMNADRHASRRSTICNPRPFKI